MIVLPAKTAPNEYFADKCYLEDMRLMSYSTWLKEHGAVWDPIAGIIIFENDHDYIVFKLKFNI
jgi:hypothetical protein